MDTLKIWVRLTLTRGATDTKKWDRGASKTIVESQLDQLREMKRDS
jgi:hypothetical protein